MRPPSQTPVHQGEYYTRVSAVYDHRPHFYLPSAGGYVTAGASRGHSLYVDHTPAVDVVDAAEDHRYEAGQVAHRHNGYAVDYTIRDSTHRGAPQPAAAAAQPRSLDAPPRRRHADAAPRLELNRGGTHDSLEAHSAGSDLRETGNHTS